MASRWRTWDKDYALDILNDPQPLNETVERAVVTFGRGKININLSECSLPVVEPVSIAGNLTSVSTLLTSTNIHGKYIGLGRGRGRRSKFIEAQGSFSQDFPGERPRFPGAAGLKKSSQEWPELKRSTSEERTETTLHQKSNPPENASKNEECDVQNPVNGEITTEVQACAKSLPVELTISPKELTTDFLKGLNEKDKWIVLDGAPKYEDTNNELIEMINESGTIEAFQQFGCGKILVRMESELHCEWVISWLDGSQVTDASDTISVLRVCDIVNDDQPTGLDVASEEDPGNNNLLTNENS
ncbi:uncharacterized protein LOC135692147 isoform X2 [Rhopilema esculentum]|uniref:uncharacterized protein LOC135692147 isoform X2 n=1 Tax=Rhopilema esculentum TaxID=499914 RepID=UPI0031DB65E5